MHCLVPRIQFLLNKFTVVFLLNCKIGLLVFTEFFGFSMKNLANKNYAIFKFLDFSRFV